LAIAPYIRRRWPRLWFFFRFLRYRYWKGENEIRALQYFVPRGRMAIDAGSSIGLYAQELAWLAPKVVAFEANPDVAAFARSVASRKVRVINVALSDENGRAKLRIPLNRRGGTTNDLATIAPGNSLDSQEFVTVEIETRQLDDYNFDDCGFIKIDVEGHEDAVLDGAEKLIQKSHPVLMIELDEGLNPGAIRRIATRLSQRSYNAYFLSRGELLPISEFRIEQHQDMETFMALSPRERRRTEYINNFIFIPREMRPPSIVRQIK
jgi:FkbM family methyltransferase